MKRHLSLSVLGLAAVIALAGCGADSGTSGESAATSSESAMSAEYNDADVTFAQGMIPHHQQAVEMSDIILAKENVNPEVTGLATQIKDAQAPEIETMTGWLEAWGEPVEAEGGHDAHSSEGADGMLSEDQMAELETSEGADASRMFLESMTVHHDGAIDMAQDEIDNGENPDAIALAEAIVEAQEAEIQKMEQMLAEL